MTYHTPSRNHRVGHLTYHITEKSMNLSNKAAFELGRNIATTLHHCGTDHVRRGAIIMVKTDIRCSITKPATRVEFDRGYSTTLDAIEPLQQGARWSY